MITNDRQYKIAKTQIQTFQQTLEELLKTPPTVENVHPLIVEAHNRAVEEQLKELMEEVKEYEDLKAGRVFITEVNNLSDLPLILIKARIANGLTQSELASSLELKEQQIQRYEAELYSSASLKTLLKIAKLLKVKIKGDVQIKEVETQEAPEILNIKNYPFKEMYKRKWLGLHGTLNDAYQKSEELLFQFFDKAGLYRSKTFGLTKKSIRTGKQTNEFALNAWYARVILKARNQIVHQQFDHSIITKEWLKNLANLSIEDDGPNKVAEYLINSGIRFVIEPQLEGTYLDGAALLIDHNFPIIAMTLRYDRLDNFWFVLFHEIAHIHLHLGEMLEAIFDDLDTKTDGIENEADAFALDALIPNEIWKKSLVRFSPSNDAIINQAKKLGVHPSLIAGRIRRETGKYHLFVDLIGQGEVRKHFSEQLN